MARDFVGVQVGPVSFVDEGVEAVLDTLRERAAVNALVIAPLTWEESVASRADYGSPGHGIVGSLPITGGAFWNPDPAYYRGGLISEFRAPDPLFAGFDVLGAVVPAAKARDMRVYPYFFETDVEDRPANVPNFAQLVEVDVYGRKAARPCLFNPHYKAWMLAAIEDVCRSYDVDGILWGVERQGPLMSMLEGAVPACFCEHCHGRGYQQGIDVPRAREGYLKVHQYLAAAQAGAEPRDGYFVSFLRILLSYPEIFLWEKLWLNGHTAFYKEVYGLVKFIDTSKEVGLGLWYRITTTNPYLRAQYDYADLKGTCDWIKPILYHVPAGARFANWMRGLQRTILKDAEAGAWIQAMYGLLHHDEGPLDELPGRGFSPGYVGRETARLAAALEGEAKIYPAIGVGMRNPGGRAIEPADIGPAIESAYGAGADGVILCRMYAEMTLACLTAAGRALRDLGRA
jgi:hypothetical protein